VGASGKKLGRSVEGTWKQVGTKGNKGGSIRVECRGEGQAKREAGRAYLGSEKWNKCRPAATARAPRGILRSGLSDQGLRNTGRPRWCRMALLINALPLARRVPSPSSTRRAWSGEKNGVPAWACDAARSPVFKRGVAGSPDGPGALTGPGRRHARCGAPARRALLGLEREVSLGIGRPGGKGPQRRRALSS
jgi:hypothetical protein